MYRRRRRSWRRLYIHDTYLTIRPYPVANSDGKCNLFFIAKFIRLNFLLQSVTLIPAMKVQVIIA
jgi:hypothetical protein